MRWQICQRDGYIEESIMLHGARDSQHRMLDTSVIRVTIALMKEIE